jgi:prephenate dehydrogenase
MDAAQHDLLVSRTSHLPHVVAATLANLVLNPANPKVQSQLCASGFRDTTRIASGSPEMWRDIALANRKNIFKSIDGLISGLKTFQAALKKSDARTLERFFASAKNRRDFWRAESISISSE